MIPTDLECDKVVLGNKSSWNHNFVLCFPPQFLRTVTQILPASSQPTLGVTRYPGTAETQDQLRVDVRNSGAGPRPGYLTVQK